MSMNIQFFATREILVIKTNQRSTQAIKYKGIWQTPTDITYDIMGSQEPAETYKEWVMSMSQDVEEDVYADDDIWSEREPVGKRIYNAEKNHVAEFDEWITQCEAEGYTIHAEAW